MIKTNGIFLFYSFILNLVCCLNSNLRKKAYILYSPKSTKSTKSPFRRWNNPQNNDHLCNLNEMDETSTEDLYNESIANECNLKDFSKDINNNIYIETNRRGRRIKRNKHLLSLYNNTNIKATNFIYPMFIHEEVFRLKTYLLCIFVKEKKKSVYCEESYNENSYYCKAINKIKEKFLNDIVIYTDVALDPYNIYGHDGIYDEKKREILNDISVHTLVKQSLCLAKSGADVVCPSDSMDNRIEKIRKNLDFYNFKNILILSYTCKYSSCMYKPFRSILSSNISKNLVKNKQSYQHDFNNYIDLNNVERHIEEGADIIMVKPSMFYLDIISSIKNRLREKTNVPIAVYNVSGEYMMIKNYVKYLNEDINYENELLTELFKSYLRAGANIIITYFAKQFCLYMKNLYEKNINIDDNSNINFNIELSL
ncbi:porphobilinogen synthase, putative [Plasmodium malariae]|uniref:Delta-aminolevulinic acid dehydratase n=1 Tax=Plasmodium malariae TaxID=5858 RepID=A0A1D3SQX8_PLAMA|nr:porphobilinogen synthase, putative [Plasmodium malariae]SCO94170.1 porphobilinogen synthase, putative [Plasmodium malariae]